MTEAAAVNQSDVRRPASRRPWRFGAVSLAIFGVITAFFAATLIGYGLPSVFFVVLGVVGGPVIGRLLAKASAKSGVVAQVGGLAILAGVSASIGFWTTRPAPHAAFAEVFRMQPPGGVSELSARRQFFDGTITLLRFRATNAAIAQCVAGGGLQPETLEGPWTSDQWRHLFNEAPIADRSWLDAPNIVEPHVYSKRAGGSSTAHVTLLWDAATGEAYVDSSN